MTVALQALACAVVLVHAAPAVAHDDSAAAPHGLSASLGIGTVNMTTYEGSAERRTVVGLDFSLSYRTQDWGGVELGLRGLTWQALEVGGFKLGLAAAVDPGRKTKVSSAGDPTPGDKRLTWADKRYMQAYFGVTPAQARAWGYRTYTPKAGVRKFEAGVGAEYAFATGWKIQGALTLSQLTGDAADSPLVARKSSTALSVGVAYAF